MELQGAACAELRAEVARLRAELRESGAWGGPGVDGVRGSNEDGREVAARAWG